MACKALKLEVPFSVEYMNGSAVQVDDTLFQGDHVVQHEDYVLVRNFFEEGNVVRDVTRYRIGAEEDYVRPADNRYCIYNNRYIIPCCDVLASQQQPHPGNIVLLLESPHECEYTDRDIGSPKVPACGPTGDNIDRTFLEAGGSASR